MIDFSVGLAHLRYVASILLALIDYLGWLVAEVFPESSTEVGWVAESYVVGYVTDLCFAVSLL